MSSFQTKDHLHTFPILLLSGCSKAGKSTTANNIPSFFKAQRASTTSNNCYKYVAETKRRLSFNVLVFSNDEFRASGGLEIDWNRMHQSLLSVTQNTPGLSLVIIEGHRVFQNQGLIEMSNYIAWLTTSPSILRSCGCTPESLELHCTRINPFVEAIAKSKHIFKLDAAGPQRNIVKKLIAFILLKDLGLRQPGKAKEFPKLRSYLDHFKVLANWIRNTMTFRCKTVFFGGRKVKSCLLS